MELITKKEILKNQVNKQNISGIYFLIKNNKIIYVGQTSHFISRLAEHISSKKKFNSYSFIPVKNNQERLKLEVKYIKKLNPRENVQSKGNNNKRNIPSKFIIKFKRHLLLKGGEIMRKIIRRCNHCKKLKFYWSYYKSQPYMCRACLSQYYKKRYKNK